jgi:hypothetical protein
MIALDVECVSRLLYAMLQSCLHGTVTAFLLLKLRLGVTPVFHIYALVLFALWTMKCGPRLSAELREIADRLRLHSRRFCASFLFLQVCSWLLGFELYLARKDGRASLVSPPIAGVFCAANAAVIMYEMSDARPHIGA